MMWTAFILTITSMYRAWHQLDIVSRKNNVNALVSQVYSTIKSIKPDCTFGISPAGNPDNARSQGADIDTWLSTPGYIDYIMPQIYCTDVYMTGGVATRMFTNRCNAWQALNKQQLPMYVGLALYRVGTSSKTDLAGRRAIPISLINMSLQNSSVTTVMRCFAICGSRRTLPPLN